MNDTVTREPPALQASLTVLCVDDEPNILSALRRLLRPQGYHVLTAPGGAEGLEIMRDTRVDLVLSDMRMPEMDGAAFLEQVMLRSPDTVRILLTGYSDLDSTVAAVNNAGIYRYISKPWKDEDILGALGDALERKYLKMEKARLEELTQEQNEELKSLNATLEAKVEARTAELAAALGKLEQAHATLKKSFFTSIRLFSNLIELREGSSAGHSRHVADSARRLAQRMKLTDIEVHDVTLAGLLHGVGELGLPDALLCKSLSAMTMEERTKVMKNPVRAQAALMALEQLSGAGKLIRSYRERFDGAGYPDRLAGLAIPIGASVLAVAHDYEAAQEGTLTGRWLSKIQARDHLVAGRGSRYAAEVVDAFLAQIAGAGVQPVERGVAPADLEESMVLSRDLVSSDGLLLLSKGTVLDADRIAQVRNYQMRDDETITVHVRLPQAAHQPHAS